METSFKNADEAFKYYYNLIHADGIDFGDTRTLFNVGFTLRKPKETWITSTFRQWNEKYAEAGTIAGNSFNVFRVRLLYKPF